VAAEWAKCGRDPLEVDGDQPAGRRRRGDV